MNNRSIRDLSPDFAIPPGTQVVVTKHQYDQSNQLIRKSGSVGVVVKCPPNNSQPYLVRFQDESEISISFCNLTTRRREIDNILSPPIGHELFREAIIYKCQVGSHAFGLANENSDTDIRGIFLPTADQDWSLYETPEQIEFKDDDNDEVYWELEKFIKLALKANPNILETLWTPKVIQADPIAKQLRDSRTAFLSKHLYKTYSGYVLSQFRRMKNAFENKGHYKQKHAMHLIRLLHSGINALKTGEIMIDVSKHRDQLLAIKSGELTFEQVRRLALDLDKQFQTEFETTNLPEQPDFKTANELLIQARRSMVQD